MSERITEGAMAFLVGNADGIGAIRKVGKDKITVYVENAGDFILPLSAVAGVREQKVMLDPAKVGDDLLQAIKHAHDREDPKLVG